MKANDAMISMKEIKLRCVRENARSNSDLHFFASRFSPYFTWVFVNLGISANGVTLLFFLVGMIGAYLASSQSVLGALASYVLWRIHIVIDMSDGEVARFNQKFSINGAYWDAMIHAVLYPLYFVSISLGIYALTLDNRILILAPFACLVCCLMLAAKNNYFKALYLNNQPLDQFKRKAVDIEASSITSKKFFNIVASCCGFEGFLFVITLCKIITLSSEAYLVVLVLYTLAFFGIGFSKFLMLSLKGAYRRRN